MLTFSIENKISWLEADGLDDCTASEPRAEAPPGGGAGDGGSVRSSSPAPMRLRRQAAETRRWTPRRFFGPRVFRL